MIRHRSMDVSMRHGGEEITYIMEMARNSKNVWTIIESGDEFYYAAGFRLENRQGYIVTEKSWETGEEEVLIDESSSRL